MDEQTIDLMFSSKSNEWETPPEFFKMLEDEFSFTLDPAATEENHLCKKYYTMETDGLNQSWKGETVFVNPPYGRGSIDRWVEKCFDEAFHGTKIVLLIPSRTDTKWFHKYIYAPANGSSYGDIRYRFLKGRLKFKNKLYPQEKLTPAPFPSMLVYYNL